jgi:hypothetical protein
MKFYVATKWNRKDEAKRVIAALQERGHEITHDWTEEEDSLGLPDAARAEFYALCAADDVDGVLDADVMLLLHDAAARGAYVELGIALAHGVRVIVVDGLGHPAETCPIFYYLPEVRHVATMDEAIRWAEAA